MKENYRKFENTERLGNRIINLKFKAKSFVKLIMAHILRWFVITANVQFSMKQQTNTPHDCIYLQHTEHIFLTKTYLTTVDVSIDFHAMGSSPAVFIDIHVNTMYPFILCSLHLRQYVERALVKDVGNQLYSKLKANVRYLWFGTIYIGKNAVAKA